jgi:hypothetical protein
VPTNQKSNPITVGDDATSSWSGPRSCVAPEERSSSAAPVNELNG